MALTTLSLATIPAKFALPVAAGMVAGTVTLGAYLVQPTSVAASAPSLSEVATVPCEQQTWPYVAGNCISQGAQARAVRVLLTSRDESERSIPAPQAAIEEASKSIALQQRETVLRAPEHVAPVKAAMPRVTRTEPRRPRVERRFVAQSYDVPAEARGTSRAIMVVRPLRIESLP